MADLREIFLQPKCCADEHTGRLWCEDDAPVDCEDECGNEVPWTRYVRADLYDELIAERALLVTRAENAEAALVEADERHSRYVKAVGELAGMAARLAEADAMLMDALPAVQSRIRKHQRSWEAAMKRGDEFHTRKHCEQMNKDLALEARIDAHLSRKEQE